MEEETADEVVVAGNNLEMESTDENIKIIKKEVEEEEAETLQQEQMFLVEYPNYASNGEGDNQDFILDNDLLNVLPYEKVKNIFDNVDQFLVTAVVHKPDCCMLQCIDKTVVPDWHEDGYDWIEVGENKGVVNNQVLNTKLYEKIDEHNTRKYVYWLDEDENILCLHYAIVATVIPQTEDEINQQTSEVQEIPQMQVTFKKEYQRKEDKKRKGLRVDEALALLESSAETLSMSRAIRPKGGEIYMFNTDVIGEDWKCDDYVWRNCGTAFLPSKNPLLKKTFFSIRTPETKEKGSTNFQKIAFFALDKPNIVMVQYIGDENVYIPMAHGNRKRGAVEHKRTCPSVLEKIKHGVEQNNPLIKVLPYVHNTAADGPRNMQQISNFKHRAKKRKLMASGVNVTQNKKMRPNLNQNPNVIVMSKSEVEFLENQPQISMDEEGQPILPPGYEIVHVTQGSFEHDVLQGEVGNDETILLEQDLQQVGATLYQSQEDEVEEDVVDAFDSNTHEEQEHDSQVLDPADNVNLQSQFNSHEQVQEQYEITVVQEPNPIETAEHELSQESTSQEITYEQSYQETAEALPQEITEQQLPQESTEAQDVQHETVQEILHEQSHSQSQSSLSTELIPPAAVQVLQSQIPSREQSVNTTEEVDPDLQARRLQQQILEQRKRILKLQEQKLRLEIETYGTNHQQVVSQQNQIIAQNPGTSDNNSQPLTTYVIQNQNGGSSHQQVVAAAQSQQQIVSSDNSQLLTYVIPNPDDMSSASYVEQAPEGGGEVMEQSGQFVGQGLDHSKMVYVQDIDGNEQLVYIQ